MQPELLAVEQVYLLSTVAASYSLPPKSDALPSAICSHEDCRQFARGWLFLVENVYDYIPDTITCC